MNEKKFNLIFLLILCVILFFTIRFTTDSSISWLLQAENSGEIKFEIRDQNNILKEEQQVLVNTKHSIYKKKINTQLKDHKLLLYFDSSHQTLASKGVFILKANLAFHWLSSSIFANQASLHNVEIISHSWPTSQFSGFGDNAHIEVELEKDSFGHFLPLVFLIALVSVIIMLAGQVLVRFVERFRFLSEHKLRLLIVLFFISIFSSPNFIESIILLAFSVYCVLLYSVRNTPAAVRNYKNYISVSLLFILFLGFGAQAQIISKIKTEFLSQPNMIKFDFFDQFGKRFSKLFSRP